MNKNLEIVVESTHKLSWIRIIFVWNALFAFNYISLSCKSANNMSFRLVYEQDLLF